MIVYVSLIYSNARKYVILVSHATSKIALALGLA